MVFESSGMEHEPGSTRRRPGAGLKSICRLESGHALLRWISVRGGAILMEDDAPARPFPGAVVSTSLGRNHTLDAFDDRELEVPREAPV